MLPSLGRALRLQIEIDKQKSRGWYAESGTPGKFPGGYEYCHWIEY